MKIQKQIYKLIKILTAFKLFHQTLIIKIMNLKNQKSWNKYKDKVNNNKNRMFNSKGMKNVNKDHRMIKKR